MVMTPYSNNSHFSGDRGGRGGGCGSEGVYATHVSPHATTRVHQIEMEQCQSSEGRFQAFPNTKLTQPQGEENNALRHAPNYGGHVPVDITPPPPPALCPCTWPRRVYPSSQRTQRKVHCHQQYQPCTCHCQEKRVAVLLVQTGHDADSLGPADNQRDV